MIKSNIFLLFGDFLVLDRWIWLRKYLPRTSVKTKLLDVGCGTGALSIKAAERGYDVIGLSWDENNNIKANKRASDLRLNKNCKFEVFDIRTLEKFSKSGFDFIINTENIEHILNDRKLFRDMASKLTPGGFLLLTTPHYFYNSISGVDDGPFCKTETGGHVRRGYSKSMLKELCRDSGLEVEVISSCSGFLSQKITWFWRLSYKILGKELTFIFFLPFRLLPILFDKYIKKITLYQNYSICLVAYKNRFNEN